MKKALFILFACCATIMFTSCEGPMGPAGLDGSLDESCKVCHNESTTGINARMDQFNQSAKANGTYFDRDGQCAACHNTEGFLARADYTSVSQIDDFTGAKTAHSCYTCHNIHTDYEWTDFSLTFADQVTETILGYSSPDVDQTSFPDYGNANLCMQCHQSRDRGNVPSLTTTSDVEITSSHWGPHYGVQGNVFNAMGGVNIAGSASYPATGTGHAGAIDDACITCHMHENNHSFAVNFEACVSCHTDADVAEDLKDALETEIHDQLFVLGALLETQGVMKVTYDTDSVTPISYSPIGSSSSPNVITATQARALWNYMVVYQTHGYGVHNPSYIRALLTNSIAAVTP